MFKLWNVGRWTITLEVGKFAAFALVAQVEKSYQMVRLAVGPVSLAAVRT